MKLGEKVKGFVKENAQKVGAAVGTVAGAAGGLVANAQLAFAEETPVVTALQLQEITDVITANLGVLLPVGITIMGVMIGVALIPRIIYKFF